jgi:hypothetical protein
MEALERYNNFNYKMIAHIKDSKFYVLMLSPFPTLILETEDLQNEKRHIFLFLLGEVHKLMIMPRKFSKKLGVWSGVLENKNSF